MKELYIRTKVFIRKKINCLHAYDYEPTRDGWCKHSEPVLGNIESGSIFDPCVKLINGKFIMFVSERKTGSIIRLCSNDGICWSDKRTVLTGVDNSVWERVVNRPYFLLLGKIWYLWYTGQANGKSYIGLAISENGIDFRRVKTEPVLSPKMDYEKYAVMNPCVIKKNNQFQMWYASGENFEPDVICTATSDDGITWKRYINNPILKASNNEYDKCKVGACDILENGNQMVMFYIGYQNIDTARICVAFSSDGGYTWKRNSQNPIISPSAKSWDAHAVYKPSVCAHDGYYYLWYNGRKKHEEYIGLAKKEK